MNHEVWKEKQNILLRGDLKRQIKPKRKYPHFDTRINEVTKDIVNEITNTDKTTSHQFYPFISYISYVRKREKKEKYVGFRKKSRQICYASHRDALLLSWYAHQLQILYEKRLVSLGLQSNVLAYRSKIGSNVDHASVAFRSVQDMDSANVVCADITGFFDNLSHRIIKHAWLALLQFENPRLSQLPKDHYSIFRAITKFASVDAKHVYDALGFTAEGLRKSKPARLCTVQDFRSKIAHAGLIKINDGGKGIPQGSPISALIANMYMLEFDIKLKSVLEKVGGKYFRYSDDIFVAAPEGTLEISELENLLIKEISGVDLGISVEKTETYTLRQENRLEIIRNTRTGRKKGLNYLGMSFDGHCILFKHASLARYQKKAIAAVRSALRFHFRENKPVPKRNLNMRFTKLGKQNFQSYVRRAAATLRKHGFSSRPLEKQANDFFVHKAVRNPIIRDSVQKQVSKRKARKRK